MYRFELYRLVDAPLTRSCNPYLLVAVTLMSVPVVVWLRRQTLLAAIDGGGTRPEQDSGSKLRPECAHGCTCRGRQIERWMRMESSCRLRREDNDASRLFCLASARLSGDSYDPGEDG